MIEEPSRLFLVMNGSITRLIALNFSTEARGRNQKQRSGFQTLIKCRFVLIHNFPVRLKCFDLIMSGFK